MASLKWPATALVVAVSVTVGVLAGSWRSGEAVAAQTRRPRFQTERHGELLFIRHFNTARGVDCFIGMDGAGILSVPCDPSDLEARQK